MHPRLQEGTTLGFSTFDDSSDRHYFIADRNDRRYSISFPLYRELSRADGTHPLHISRELLEKLKDYDLLTTRRFLFDGVLNRFILFPIGSNARRFRPVCRVLNVLLPVLALVLFVISMVLLGRSRSFRLHEVWFPAYFLLLAFSLFAHECAHLIAGISYGYRFSEMGLLLLGIFPFGAYVAYYQKKRTRVSARVQLSLAGIEANLLLGSLFLILSLHPFALDGTFRVCAIMNFFLAALNLVPASGLDGGAVLSALLGFDKIGDSSKLFFMDKDFRKRVLRAGPRGYLCAVFFCINLLANVFVVLLLAFDMVTLVLSFF